MGYAWFLYPYRSVTCSLTSSDVAYAPMCAVHSGFTPRWRRPCESVEKKSHLEFLLKFAAVDPLSRSTESARKETVGLSYWAPAVAHAVCVCEDDDGPLRLTQNQKQSQRRSPCKNVLIQRLQILHRLWTLPFKLLTGVICVIVRRRSGSPARALENSADQRCEYNSQNHLMSHKQLTIGAKIS